MGSSIEPPDGLADGGKRVWASITGEYGLRPDELVTLLDVCRLTDMIDALEDAWRADGCPVTTKGSMGQLVTHPMISEIRTHRMARNVLWRQLKLPDVDGSAEANQHRSAANSRWASAYGKGA